MITNKINKVFLILLILILYISIEFKINYKNIVYYPKFKLDEYKNIFFYLNKNLYENQTKIENIFILIIIFPFLKNEIIITKKNPLYGLIKKLFNIKNNEEIKINKNNLNMFSHKFNEFLYYKWEILPNKNKTNYLRHIIYHYYNDECLKIFEKSLNLNIKYYIDNNKITYNLINDLMSKI